MVQEFVRVIVSVVFTPVHVAPLVDVVHRSQAQSSCIPNDLFAKRRVHGIRGSQNALPSFPADPPPIASGRAPIVSPRLPCSFWPPPSITNPGIPSLTSSLILDSALRTLAPLWHDGTRLLLAALLTWTPPPLTITS